MLKSAFYLIVLEINLSIPLRIRLGIFVVFEAMSSTSPLKLLKGLSNTATLI